MLPIHVLACALSTDSIGKRIRGQNETALDVSMDARFGPSCELVDKGRNIGKCNPDFTENSVQDTEGGCLGLPPDMTQSLHVQVRYDHGTDTCTVYYHPEGDPACAFYNDGKYTRYHNWRPVGDTTTCPGECDTIRANLGSCDWWELIPKLSDDAME